MSITDVNTAPGQTPVSYPNQAFINIVNPQQAIHNYCEPSQMNSAALLYSRCPSLSCPPGDKPTTVFLPPLVHFTPGGTLPRPVYLPPPAQHKLKKTC